MIAEEQMESPTEVVTVTYNFPHPVEVQRFSQGLEGLAVLYKGRVAADTDAPNELRLYIKEIRKGSVEVDLIEMVKTAGGVLAPIMPEVKLITETFSRTKDVLNWLKGDSAKVEPPTKKEIEAAASFVAPVAEISGSNVQINVAHSPGTQIYIGSPEANVIQNKAAKAIESMRMPATTLYREVPLVWVQTDREGASRGRTGSKALVEAVSDVPMPVYFPEENREVLTEAMVGGVDYPYRKTFIVDVEAMVVMGKLKGYRIQRLHDTLE